jgi:hypothetical protein
MYRDTSRVSRMEITGAGRFCLKLGRDMPAGFAGKKTHPIAPRQWGV